MIFYALRFGGLRVMIILFVPLLGRLVVYLRCGILRKWRCGLRSEGDHFLMINGMFIKSNVEYYLCNAPRVIREQNRRCGLLYLRACILWVLVKCVYVGILILLGPRMKGILFVVHRSS